MCSCSRIERRVFVSGLFAIVQYFRERERVTDSGKVAPKRAAATPAAQLQIFQQIFLERSASLWAGGGLVPARSGWAASSGEGGGFGGMNSQRADMFGEATVRGGKADVLR